MKANKINRNPLLLVWALKAIVTPHDTNKPRSTEMIILYWETLEQFRYVKIHAWLRGLGEYWLTTCVIHLWTTKVISCFIPPSLTAKYEFINIHWYCTIPLTFGFNWSRLHWQFLIYFHNVWNLCNKVCKKWDLQNIRRTWARSPLNLCGDLIKCSTICQAYHIMKVTSLLLN